MYRCGGYSRDIPGCRSNAILIKHLDAAVWSKVETVLTTPEIIEREVERLRHADPAGEDLAALDRRLAEIAARQVRIGRAVAALDDEEAAAPLLLELKALATQKRQLDAERADAEAQRAGWQVEQARLADLQTWCHRVASNLPTLDYRQKRDLLAALDVHVKLFQKGQDAPRWVITMSPDEVVYGGSGGRTP